MVDIDRMVRDEVAWLSSLEAQTQNTLLGIYQESLIEIGERISEMPDDRMNLVHLRAIEAQLDVVLQEMYAQQNSAISNDLRNTYGSSLRRSQDAWVNLENFYGAPDVAEIFENFLPVIPQRAIQALATTAGYSISRFTDNEAARIRTTLARSLVLGEGTQTAARRLRDEGFDTSRAHLNLIARMELSRAQDSAKTDLIEQINQKHPDLEMWEVVRERLDHTSKTRNHFFSFALHNTARNVTAKENFEVTLVSFEMAKSKWVILTKRKPPKGKGGVVWPSTSFGYGSKTLPAHFNGREVKVPWRPAWGIQIFGGQGVHHPQGPIGSMHGKDSLRIGNYDHSKMSDYRTVSNRHYPQQITSKVEVNNTMVLGVPKFIINNEINEIKNGLARFQDGRYYVGSGRVYEHHQTKDRKTQVFYPVDGPGLALLNREEYKLLLEFKKR